MAFLICYFYFRKSGDDFLTEETSESKASKSCITLKHSYVNIFEFIWLLSSYYFWIKWFQRGHKVKWVENRVEGLGYLEEVEKVWIWSNLLYRILKE